MSVPVEVAITLDEETKEALVKLFLAVAALQAKVEAVAADVHTLGSRVDALAARKRA